VTDGKKVKEGEVPPATAGAVRPPEPSKFPRTLVAEPVPPELKAAVPARERTIEVSASDADVMIETNPSITKSEIAGRSRTVASQEPTDPGVLRRQRQLRRRMALGAAGGLGLIAAAIAARGIAHRSTASRSPPPEVPAASAPAVASSTPPPAAAPPPTAAEPMVATVDSATPPPDAQAPAASASSKTPAPKTHPARTKHPPAKGVR
jgi:hypothetical protein